MFCLPKQFTDKLKETIRSGSLNPEKLNTMTSAERREFLGKIIGEGNAKEVNLLFEKKLLLKNQEKAMYDWAREITGLSSKDKTETLEKIRKTYADKNRRLYDPKENEQFLNEITADIYSKKYKTDVSLEEAQTITELAQDLKEAKNRIGDNFDAKTIADGVARVALDNYLGNLKREAQKESLINPLEEKGVADKIGALGQDFRISSNFIAENARALKASWDNSFWGRQGIKVLFNPKYSKIWATNFLKSFKDIGITLRGGNEKADALVDAVKAEIYSRKNFRNGRYEMGKKLDVGTGEEAYPTSMPSRLGSVPILRDIPILKQALEGLGRIFRASEVAYELGAMRLRADIADRLYELAERQQRDLSNKEEVGSINTLTNSLTGRGEVPLSVGKQAFLNKAFFSVKFLKSNLDFLTAHLFDKTSSFAKKQAAFNLLSTVGTIGVVLGIAKAFDKDSVDFDPRSSNFGKIKFGNTRFDITGGMSPLVTLVSRIATQSSKSSTTGMISKFGEGYGSQTGMDVLWNFTENKFSPAFSVIRDLIQQQTFSGDKPTLLNEAQNLTVPMLISTGYEAATTEKSANLLLVLIADALGISTNTYAYQNNWNTSTSKELQQFKQKVGEKTFKEANNEYNKKISETFSSDKYKLLEDEEQQKYLTDQKDKIKQRIFEKYRFKYEKKK